MAKKNFTVTFSMRGFVDVNVEADTEDEAVDIAEKKWEEMDLDPFCFSDGGVYSVEEEDGPTAYFE